MVSKAAQEEIIVIFENAKIKVEKIVSNGAVSPSDFWYDNPVDEWVNVTKGNAVLQLEHSEIKLRENSNYYIKAHEKHRVKYTSSDCEWLCVYIKGIE